MTVALVTSFIKPAVGDGVFDGAIVLMRVGAVGKAARVDVRPEVPKKAFDFVGRDIPELELADARSIDDVSARAQRQQPCRGCRVFSLFGILADRLDMQVERRIDGVEQGGLSNAALPGHHAGLARQPASQSFDPEAGFCTQEHDFVAHLRVGAYQRLNACRIRQVDFVDADDRANPPFFGGNEQSVDQIGFQSGLGDACDNRKLIDVGDQDLLTAAHRPANAAVARLDALDERFLGLAVGDGANEDAITCRDDVPLIGAQRFEEPSCGAPKRLAGFGFDNADQSEDAQDTAAAAHAFIDIEPHVESWTLLALEHFSSDRAASGQSSFAANPFDGFGGGVFKAVSFVLLRPVGGPSTHTAIFAKLRSDFPFFGHPIDTDVANVRSSAAHTAEIAGFAGAP